VQSGGINGAITPHSSFNLVSLRASRLTKKEKIETFQVKFLPNRLCIDLARKNMIQFLPKSSRKKWLKERSLSNHK